MVGVRLDFSDLAPAPGPVRQLLVALCPVVRGMFAIRTNGTHRSYDLDGLFFLGRDGVAIGFAS